MSEEIKVTRRYHPMFGCVVKQIRIRSTPLEKPAPKTATRAPAQAQTAPPPPDWIAAVKEAYTTTVPTQRVLAEREAHVIAVAKTGVPEPPDWIDRVRRSRR